MLQMKLETKILALQLKSASTAVHHFLFKPDYIVMLETFTVSFQKHKTSDRQSSAISLMTATSRIMLCRSAIHT